MGKKGNPDALNGWASSLSSASSALDTVVADLKAASPYTLQDASFGNQKVTAGTTQVTVGHYSGYMGNPGAPIHKTETKWVTEKVLTSSGVAQNSGSFMTWLPGTVPSFGNTANTWQGYAASMFANLLQDFVNTIEEIKNTVDQLSKELSALATSISDSRKWWKILLGVIVMVLLVVITIAVNIFFPGLGSAILGVLSNGLRFVVGLFSFGGEVTGEAAVAAIDIGSTFEFASSLGAFSEEFGVSATPEVIDGLDGFGGLGDIFANAEDIFTTAPEMAPYVSFGPAEVAPSIWDNWLTSLVSMTLGKSGVSGIAMTNLMLIENWINYGSPFKGWSILELAFIVGAFVGTSAALLLGTAFRGAAIGLGALLDSGIPQKLVDWMNNYKFITHVVLRGPIGGLINGLVAEGIMGSHLDWRVLLLSIGLNSISATADYMLAKYFNSVIDTLKGNWANFLKGGPLAPLPKFKTPAMITPGKPITVFPDSSIGNDFTLIPFKFTSRGIFYPLRITLGGLVPGHIDPWLPAVNGPLNIADIYTQFDILPPGVTYTPGGILVPNPPSSIIVPSQIPQTLSDQRQELITLNSNINAQEQLIQNEIAALEASTNPDPTVLQALYTQKGELQTEISIIDQELSVVGTENPATVSPAALATQSMDIYNDLTQIALQAQEIASGGTDAFPALPTFA